MTNLDSMFGCPKAAIKTITHVIEVQASCELHYEHRGEPRDCGTCLAWCLCGGER